MTEADVSLVARLEEQTLSPWPVAELFSDGAGTGILARVAEFPEEHHLHRVAGWYLARGMGPEAELYKISVTADLRRRGIGRALLNDLEKGLHSLCCTSLFLEMRRSDAGLLRYYRRSGFSILGTRAGYYRNPREDALLLGKRLKTSPQPQINEART
jgi:ribosomal-protein-alanine N-acetyltransferase